MRLSLIAPRKGGHRQECSRLPKSGGELSMSLNKVTGSALARALVLVGISGCVSPARLVATDANYAIVAIPSNTDTWPNHYRKHAEELMNAKFPRGYVIDKEEEVVVGTTQFTNRN